MQPLKDKKQHTLEKYQTYIYSLIQSCIIISTIVNSKCLDNIVVSCEL